MKKKEMNPFGLSHCTTTSSFGCSYLHQEHADQLLIYKQTIFYNIEKCFHILWQRCYFLVRERLINCEIVFANLFASRTYH